MMKQIERITLIYNPTAGALRRNPTIINRLVAALEARHLAVTLSPTKRAYHATELAREAVRAQADCVLVCGGDGTINEAVQALVGTDTALAIWPGGTANVLAKELRLPNDPDATAALITQQHVRAISVGKAVKPAGDQTPDWERYFLVMAGIGLDATIVQNVDLKLKKRLGTGAYLAAGLGFLARLPLTPFSITFNGQRHASTFAVISNAANYASMFSLTPDARLTDDRFKVCLFNSQSRLAYLGYALLSTAGRHIHTSGVTYEAAQYISANSNNAALVQLDGEVAGHLPMRFENLPQALRVVAPPQQ
ncbi:MAG: diacylglycerol kinase family lipid kinase [Acidobacteria bacterium]|nr:diacylglycerol kinase family lipid kinase [Acidobacteriota bacterium]MBI3426832.1 diacylglycerol kinase family lipid kinase [Acidobacteriota bacterium]